MVVFLDADSVPQPGWGAGLARALTEFPGAIVGCARTFSARTAWGWVGYLQSETPYLPLGEPRPVRFLCSHCLAVPRTHRCAGTSYGGRTGSSASTRARASTSFDPRFETLHEHEDSFATTYDGTMASGSPASVRFSEAPRKRIFAERQCTTSRSSGSWRSTGA
jgi:hypothetical protein